MDQLQYLNKYDNLKLVPLNIGDKENLSLLFSDPEVSRFFLGNQPVDQAVEEHLSRAERNAKNPRDRFDGLWAIMHDGAFVGIFMLTAIDVSDLLPEQRMNFRKVSRTDLYLNVAYALNPNYRGKGLASRSLTDGLEFAKNQLKAKFVFASTNHLNGPSKEVLFRNGFSVMPTWMIGKTKFYKRLN